MIVLIFCLLLTIIKADSLKTINNNFMILGGTIDFTPINIKEKECEYSTTCISIICESLSNKTLSNMGLAYIILFPIESLKCSTIPFTSNVTMMTFIMSYEEKFMTPIACDNVGECFTKTCILFNTRKNNIGIGFTGQCL